jgi:ketosteroid isomerase-like protein
VTLPQRDDDRAAVLREVRAAFEQYEAALIRHDVAALNGFFLDSVHAIRYGLAEQNYGIEAIAAYRASSAPVHRQRRLLRVEIASLSADVACVSAEFTDPTSAQLGRQTQTWVRTEAGWKIAVAHVSLAGSAR